MEASRRRRSSLAGLIALALAAAGAGHGLAAPAARRLACDDSLKAAFKPDALTTVVLVKAFHKGEPLVLSDEDDEK